MLNIPYEKGRLWKETETETLNWGETFQQVLFSCLLTSDLKLTIPLETFHCYMAKVDPLLTYPQPAM